MTYPRQESTPARPYQRPGVGKIARLPRAIRDEINFRRQEGQSGQQILRWLNAAPEVKAALEGRFRDTTISAQNFSIWAKHNRTDLRPGVKIELLPEGTKELLNRAIKRGESDESLLEFLNGEKATRAALAKAGLRSGIDAADLEIWRKRHYRAWLGNRGFAEAAKIITDETFGLGSPEQLAAKTAEHLGIPLSLAGSQRRLLIIAGLCISIEKDSALLPERRLIAVLADWFNYQVPRPQKKDRLTRKELAAALLAWKKSPTLESIMGDAGE